jgi:hypothetical protein
MAASDHLGQQFFHGSSYVFEPGQVLDPRSSPHRSEHFYFAGNRTEPTSGNYGEHLYQVEPLGPHEPDPALKGLPELESRRTQHPVRVVQKLPLTDEERHNIYVRANED